MNNFIIEQYLIYIKNIDNGEVKYYILKKYNWGEIKILCIFKDDKKYINVNDISNPKEKDFILKYINILKIKKIQYATKYIINILLKKGTLNFMEYCNAKECEFFIDGNHIVKVVRYYFDPKNRVFYKIIGDKWNKK